MRAAILSTSAMCLLLTACGSADPSITSVTVTPATASAGAQFTLNITVADFDLVNPDEHGGGHGLRAAEGADGHGEAAEGDYPSEGHFHVYFDSIDENPLKLNCPMHCKHPGFGPTVTSTVPNDATAGEHKIIVLLNDNTHKTLTPHIRGEATITVQ